MKRLTLWIALALAAGGLSATGAPHAADVAPRTVIYGMRTMGTQAGVMLVVADSSAGLKPAAAAHAALARVDSLMSNWTTTSEVARLNRDAWPQATPVQPEVADVLGAALQIWSDSDGAFDITVEPLVRAWGFLGGKPDVPTPAAVAEAFTHVGRDKLAFDGAARTLQFREQGVKVDLGGIAKGYAVDAATRALQQQGVSNALVDVSGNMYALGHPVDAGGWRIGVRDPRDRLPYFARLTLSNEAIATSGKYEQFVASNGRTYGHILDPRTGTPAEGLISVTVLASSAMAADAWGTALFVLGPEAARQKARERDDLAVILVSPGRDGVDTVWVEGPVADRFHLLHDAERFFRVVRF